ncbi:cobaltochelatase subunit CobN [Parazoarcus communis]|uniref:Cobaltochelatase subunit CobN n=1 Tax=Parazoarcus communis SWub3 = DSM 12120 TaxID=1121029 RepID=A0A323UUD4_9RHOO|nr:cobaltochelatase subunit CobN [Parazoarcus communis]NMG71407.1 cobaltochelatase subunit CobN [Parazoarcus communis SWub3 = DSM 12120]PZA15871.1 cobaltochelatase subunit CobN [Azoarcus communis] [Parazoarcus communis SWub3 = DSM 12120]
MKQRWLVLLALLLGLGSSSALARTLLWLTADITPQARSAMIERIGVESGWKVRHLDHPLRIEPAHTETHREKLIRALQGVDMVWVDAPHASVFATLNKLFGDLLTAHDQRRAGRVVWITTERAEPSSTTSEPALEQYLSAGGERNVRHAFSLAEAVIAGLPRPSLPPPQTWPARGLYHPEADRFFPDADALAAWQARHPHLAQQPAVAILVHRYHFINGSTAWLDEWLRLFQQQGLFAYAAFGQQVDATALSSLLETGAEEARQAHPRVLVLHQLTPQAAALQPLFERWQRPVLITQPYRQGDQQQWEADATGLSLGDTPFYLVQPEAAGAIDPLMVVAHADGGRRTDLILRQAEAVVAKARRLITLQTRPKADQQLVTMVYNYPPGGTNFGASFLNVPRSLQQVSTALAAHGYDTVPIPEQYWIEALPPLLQAYYPKADLLALLRSNHAAALPLADYLAWWQTLPSDVRARIEHHWGAPPTSPYVVDWNGEAVFVIPRLQIGKLAVLPQPPREETLRRGQAPFMHRSKNPLSHHYLAVYLWARQADALMHFGTHGTQEWASGKSRGLDVLDDALLPLGDLPVIYPYIVDNLGEALTAKRRGRATLISHRTPVFATAGFPARMAHMHEVMHEWEIADTGPTRKALAQQLVELIVEHQLHRDLDWSRAQVEADLDGFMEVLHPWLDQLAQSAQPRGLAVFGVAPDADMRRQIILQALRRPLLEALGEDIDETFLIDYRDVAGSRPARWLELALRDPQAASVLDLRPPAPDTAVPNRAGRREIDREALLELAERAQDLDRLLAVEGEIDGLLAALGGRFVPAVYGGDPIRNPDSLPTGRNLIGLDPSRLPTRQAYNVARLLFANWLRDYQAANNGRSPQRMVLSLWAGETLRHQGIMEAQAMVALGVRPQWDDSGRPRGVELLSEAELGRPRVDVLLSVTGSYRDQFPALMALLDNAVSTVSSAEPDGVVARHSKAVETELIQHGVAAAQARLLGQARVFGNQVGDYGTGIADAVQDDGLRRSDARLGALFLQRMSQPYLGGAALEGVSTGVAARALGAQLKRADAAILSRTSNLYGMASSDDPFQYLGGLAAAARTVGKQEALQLYVNQLQDDSEPYAERAQRSMAAELQSRYLHPGWLEAQKAEGYAGTLQVLKAVQFAWGWQTVVEDMVRPDHWQAFHDVLVRDKHQLGIPDWLRSHPQAYAQALERLVQAQRHGHWSPDDETRRELARTYAELTARAPLAQPSAAVERWVAHQLSSSIAVSTTAGVRRLLADESPRTAIDTPSTSSVAEPPMLADESVLPPAQARVRGLHLQAVTEYQDPTAMRWLALGVILLLLTGGALSQYRRAGRAS